MATQASFFLKKDATLALETGLGALGFCRHSCSLVADLRKTLINLPALVRRTAMRANDQS
jgi:hypothetical protein